MNCVNDCQDFKIYRSSARAVGCGSDIALIFKLNRSLLIDTHRHVVSKRSASILGPEPALEGAVERGKFLQ